MKVIVTQEHITEGMKTLGSLTKCVMGRALKEALDSNQVEYESFSAGVSTCRVKLKDDLLKLTYPLLAGNIAYRFHATGNDPEPFEFDLEGI